MMSESPNWLPNLLFPASAQVFRRDRALATLELVSVRPDGFPGQYPSLMTSISGDGRLVAFESRGDEHVPGEPTNAHIEDVYVRDMDTGVTEFVTWSKDGGATFAGGQSGQLSKDGRYVAFESGSNDVVVQDFNFWMNDVFVRDRQLGVTTLVSRSLQGLGISSGASVPRISGDGRVSGFSVDGATTSGMVPGVFVHECADGLTAVWCAWLQNSLGCRPVVALDGTPSVSATGGFEVTCTGLVSGTVGLFYYGTAGTQGASFQTGFQCVKPPLARAAAQATGGTWPPVSCTGSLAFDLDDWVAKAKDARLVPGTTVYGQFWSRDPGAAPPTHLSSAVAFVLQP